MTNPLINVDIKDYDFHHTPTPTQCGGAGLYIKSTLDYDIIEKVSHHNISESIFVEIKNKSKKNVTVGCIYRHHTPISDFLDTFLEATLKRITKARKTCILLGDFNIDLIKYGHQTDVSSFYDLVSTHGFRPLILQPTRVTSHSATLIDNIFTNDLQCLSKGGNITCSISDHFLQFSQIDLFDSRNSSKHIKFSRNWRIFNHREFEEEVSKIDWNEVKDPKTCTNKCFSLFFHKIENLLDEMAPFKRLTKKEIGLQQRPWITKGILISMKNVIHYINFL